VIRAKDWEDRLNEYLSSIRRAEFTWGQHDCCMHAANAVQAMTGEDPAAEFRGKYKSHAGSVRALKRKSLAEVMDAKFTQVPPAFAMRGDVVMKDGSLGICVGREGLFVGEEDGAPGLVRLSGWESAWRVPFE